MEMQVAIFDVDGTIINGNCNKIFIEYLLERNLIVQQELIPFNKKYSLYLKSEISYSEIIRESLTIFSKFEKDELRKLWEICFREIVTNRFIPKIVKYIRKFQDQGLETILASGSYINLIATVGATLNINRKNIIASDTAVVKDSEDSGFAGAICYGIEKKRMVLEYLEKRNYDLKSCYFFTDNLSDLNLLQVTGKSFWLGSEELYFKYSMPKSGIQKLKTISIPDTPEPKILKTNKLLYDYYSKNKNIIEESIIDIFPPQCTPQSMDDLAGNIDLAWDYETLQKCFFDPLYTYLKKRKEKIISLGTCLFLETGGIDIARYKPLVGMGELLDTSGEIFFDIQDWTSVGKSQTVEKSHLDISIIGNVAISLISLPTHNIIFNKLDIDGEKRLQIYESYTSIVFNSLFGNGLKLSWEHQKDIHVSFEEYCKVAFLTNMGQLKIPGDLWLILQQENSSKEFAEDMDTFIENMSIAIQLQKDLLAFEKWEKQLNQSKINRFNILNNILCIHSASHFNNSAIFSDNLTVKQIKKLLEKAGSFQYAQQILSEYLNKANCALEQLTSKRKYKNLIQAYSDCLVYR